MGDASTHAIFYQAYWYLVFNEDGEWRSTSDFNVVCNVGQEEKILELP